MEIVVLSSGSTTIRWLWLVGFMSLFMSQSCLADHDQFNFNLGLVFSRKLCPGRCSMKFELQPFFRDSPVSESMHLNASLNLERNGKKHRASKMYLSVSAAALVLIAVSTMWNMRSRDVQFIEEQETGLIESGEGTSGNDNNSHDNLQRENQAFRYRILSDINNAISKFKNFFSNETKIRNQAEFEGLTLFRFKEIFKATKSFCPDRILGKGSFGDVYKGQLNDKLIAVKRLSRSGTCSGEMNNNFYKEVGILGHIQHSNVVKLLGYCIGDENLLICEYMSNGSLNDVLFGSSMDIRLAEWKTRKNIIKGIACGILYLHEHRIIHCDINPSNILLDDNMDPKISDFGSAWTVDEYDEEVSVKTISNGTFGYMAPEYFIHEKCSIRSDVYSFGVLLLETITVKKNSSTFPYKECKMSLLEYIWTLWCETKAFDVMDPALMQSSDYNEELMRCFHIGLLCVQEDPTSRPTISSVVHMLASDDHSNFPQPTQPAYCNDGAVVATPAQSSSTST